MNMLRVAIVAALVVSPALLNWVEGRSDLDFFMVRVGAAVVFALVVEFLVTQFVKAVQPLPGQRVQAGDGVDGVKTPGEFEPQGGAAASSAARGNPVPGGRRKTDPPA